MTMYLLLLIATAVAAGLAVLIYRSISTWRWGNVEVVNLSGGSGQLHSGRQRGYIGGKRRTDGSVVWNVRPGQKSSQAAQKPRQKARKSRSEDKAIRKPWGW